jgi:hypothetical protein
MSQPPSGEYPFGRPSYIAPPYGPPDPQWGQRGRRPRRSRLTQRRLTHWRRRIRRPTVRTLTAVGALVLAVVGIGAALLLGHTRGVELAASHPSAPLSQASSPTSAAVPSTASTSVADNGTRPEPLRPFVPRSTYTSVPRATLPPTGLGSDPAMNRLASRCYDGNMQACDDLFANSATNSLYEAYGDTCAGRQAWGRDVYCTTMFPGS